MLLSLQLPDNLDVAQLVRDAAERAAQQAAAALPQPDPQYTVPQVAELLSLDPATVRAYLRLAPSHTRRLRYVDTTGTAHGWRIPLSEIQAWQARNLAQHPEELALVLTRPALRKVA
ncbi:helix-turn-helix domain-containing protein [Hymenobacter sp. RP-2-7]|uniref:Helix-turn-helix domain-containing protein n=1 Tax=Hymenobacter polaris TaxID=2682546 RepID=A0A7Y0AHT5_9BACT|nr:helix-turn-helix domain-containing protein [Hymenobacter polaris]NML67639.1 helix-turn-helix domain-containing protein [Hymenobacter polaris]